MAIVWGLELKDSVSLPANAAAAAMGTAAEQARTLQRAMDGAQAAITKAAALGDQGAVRTAASQYAQFSSALNAIPPEFRNVEKAAAKAGHAESDSLHEGSKALHENKSDVEALIGAWEVFEGSIAARAVEGALEAIKEKIGEVVDMALEARERVEMWTASFGALSGEGEEAGAHMLAAVRQVANEVPQAEANVVSWARELAAAGVTDMTALRESLRGIASAEALVEGGGERVRSILGRLNEASIKGTKIKFNIAQLAGTGLSEQDMMNALGMSPRQLELAKKQGTLTGTEIADAMVKALNVKGAKPLETQMSQLPALFQKARDNAMRLFEGVDASPLIEGLREFFSVFDTAQPSGTVMKDAIGGAFTFIFRVAGRVFSWLKDAFLHLMIWGLQAAIFIKPIAREFVHWLAAHDAVNILVTALKGLGIVLGSIAAFFVAVVVVGAAFAGMLSAAGLAVVGFVAYVIGLVPKIGEAFGDLYYKIVQVGVGFVQGFVDGIKSGVGLVVDAVKNLGSAAWNGLKNALGIHSPSTLMLQAGLQTSEGFAQGMTRGEGRVEQASIGMSMAAVVPGRDGARGASGADASSGGGRSTTVNLGGVTISINASHATSPAEHRQIVEEELASLAERLALMIGSAPVPA